MIKILLVSIKWHFLHMGRQYFVKKIDNLTIQLLDFRGSIDIVLHHSPVTALQYILIHYHALCIHHRGERRMIETYSKQMHLPHSNFTKYHRRTMHLSTHSNSKSLPSSGLFQMKHSGIFHGSRFLCPCWLQVENEEGQGGARRINSAM